MYIKIKNIYKKVEEIISQSLFYLHFFYNIIKKD